MLRFLVLVLALAPLSAIAQDAENRLTITGSARVTVEPDVARAIGNVYVQDDSAADALEMAGERLARLQSAMASMGEVRLSKTTVGQGRPAGKRLIGSDDAEFAAYGDITVTLSDIDKAGVALDALAKAGIDGVARLEYDVRDRAPFVVEAREQAVADAIERAETYARAAKITLGPIVELTEIRSDRTAPQNGPAYRSSSYGAKGATGPTTIGFSATVMIRWSVE